MSHRKGSGKGSKREQNSISTKVSAEEKQTIVALARELGFTESEVVYRAVFGKIIEPTGYDRASRELLSTCHALKTAAREGASIEAVLLNRVVDQTRELLALITRRARS